MCKAADAAVRVVRRNGGKRFSGSLDPEDTPCWHLAGATFIARCWIAVTSPSHRGSGPRRQKGDCERRSDGFQRLDQPVADRTPVLLLRLALGLAANVIVH